MICSHRLSWEKTRVGLYIGLIYSFIHSILSIGNRWYSYGEYSKAAYSYSKGIQQGDAYFQSNPIDLDTNSKEYPVFQSYISCLNNLAQCHINNNELYKAKEVKLYPACLFFIAWFNPIYRFARRLSLLILIMWRLYYAPQRHRSVILFCTLAINPP